MERPDKISNIIYNCRIDFSGSANDIGIKDSTIQRPNSSKRFHEDEFEDQSHEETGVEDEICAIKALKKIKCWICDETFHRYHDLRQSRRIFCYGCGSLEVYKPSCEKCELASETDKQDIRHVQKVDVRR